MGYLSKGKLKAGKPQAAEWGTVKKELIDLFLLKNVVWLSRESLKRLKHTSSTRDYVKEFNSLMLVIRN